MLDSIIIGGGPAGLAAAVYLARQKISFAIITKVFGGNAIWSADVENYLGFHLLDGSHLVEKFREHLKDYEGMFQLIEGDEVASLEQIPGGFKLKTAKNIEIESKTVLIASGEKHRELNIPGEKAFYGRGVTYCATCDAPLYRGKDVVVVGGGNSAMEAALFLEKYAKSVTILTVNEKLSGDAMYRKKVEASEIMSVRSKTKALKILGDSFVSGLEYETADGNKQLLQIQGVFIEIGLIPVSEFISFVKKDKAGEILVNERNETSVNGVWAAGDVTNVTEKQIAVAVGEGSKAALQIIKWLQQKT
jgi:alkyl hydroperoxide reductase subunit F